MCGGVSHVDTFDPKPALRKYPGEPLTGKGEVGVRQGYPGPLMTSSVSASGNTVSAGSRSRKYFRTWRSSRRDRDFPLRHGKSNDHVRLTLRVAHRARCGMGFPSVGAWVTYGLGTENQNLPAFVVIYDAAAAPLADRPTGAQVSFRQRTRGPFFRSWAIRSSISPPAYVTPEEQRARLDLLARLNQHDLESIPVSQRTFRPDRILRAGVSDASLCAEAVDISRKETRRASSTARQ